MYVDIDFIRKVRELQNLSFSDIARMTGHTKATIGQIEKYNTKALSEENLKRVLRIIGIECTKNECYFAPQAYIQFFLDEVIPLLSIDYEPLLWTLNILISKMNCPNIYIYKYVDTNRMWIDRAVFGNPCKALILCEPTLEIKILFRRKILSGYLADIRLFEPELQRIYGAGISYSEIQGNYNLTERNIPVELINQILETPRS